MNIPILRLSLFLFVVFSILSMSSCWYTKQAFHFLSERASAVPSERVANDPDSQDDVRLFLKNVEMIRKFAVDMLGMAASSNYTRYVTLDRDYVADVVSACASTSFTRHYWRYPIVGSLPYKGFYVEPDAKREVERLKAAGLDVIVRKVDAFSSLGYFSDPLYSFMVKYELDVIAELIFHESAHATLFIKGADQFNEEFATFLGRKATESYLDSVYGPDSNTAVVRRQRAADGEAFVSFLKETARLLDLIYNNQELDTAARLLKKQQLIKARADVYREKSALMFSGAGYKEFDMGTINNAFIDMYRLYEEDLNMFEAWYNDIAMESLPQFIYTLKELSNISGKNIKEAMVRRLDS